MVIAAECLLGKGLALNNHGPHSTMSFLGKAASLLLHAGHEFRPAMPEPIRDMTTDSLSLFVGASGEAATKGTLFWLDAPNSWAGALDALVSWAKLPLVSPGEMDAAKIP